MANATRYQLFLIGISLIALLVCGSPNVWAQDNPVSAQVDRKTIGSDETVTLSVIISGANGGQPALPALDGFQLLSTSTASQFSIVNGQTSAQITYQYILQPTRTGALQIPPITVQVGGQSYSTESIAVQVVQGAAPSQPGANLAAPSASAGRDFFVTSEVDQPTVYLGQQVTYRFRFYQGANLFDQPSYQAPDFTGFWHEQKSDQSQTRTTVGGRAYQVTTLPTLLFPTVPGVQTISPAALSMPGSLFQRGTTLQTDPITVTVLPLPQPAPADFTGAVGQMAITATVSADVVAVNEPVTLRLILQGAGNAANWPNPTVPAIAGWRSFDSTVKSTNVVTNGRLIGTRTYEQLLVPTTAGPATLPAIAYSYFDPEAASYQTIHTQPFTLTVNAAAAEAPIPTVGVASQAPMTIVERDIRHIKSAPTRLGGAAVPLTSRPLYWLAWGGALVVIVGDGLWRRRRQRLAQDPVRLRRSQAQKNAQQQLTQARRKRNSDPHPVVAQVLTDYLSAKLNQPVAGMTQNTLAERLHNQRVDEPLVSAVNDLLARSEFGRFAPTTTNGSGDGDLLTETATLINRLEKAL